MSDDLMSKEMFSEENVNKVRASSAEIVVHGTKEQAADGYRWKKDCRKRAKNLMIDMIRIL